jgi:hypothetical protein
VAEAEREEWFNSSNPVMGTAEVSIFAFSDIEGDYIFDTEVKGMQEEDNCFMFSLDFPLLWRTDLYTGPKTRNEIVRLIRDAARPLLKDDINWDERLGVLIGSLCG